MARLMKQSGVDWLGDIPDDWTTPKFSAICSVITDYVASGSFASLAENVKYLDEPDYAMLVRTADVSNKGYNPKPVYINQHAYKFLSNSNLFGGELMFPNIGASVGDVYIVPVLYKRMSLAPNAIMVKTNKVDRYYYYYFQSKPGRLSIEDIAQSTAQAKFNKTDFRQLRVLLPPIDEQQRIAAFLDGKCARIDSVVEKTRASIEEYRKLKQAIITRAVTRGIRANRTLKHSGIEWLGDIPDDWELVSIGRLFNISAGGDAKPEYYSDTQDEEHPYPVYTNSMNKNQVYAYTSKPIYLANTITVTGRGAIGTAFYRNTPYDAIIRLLSLSPKLDLDCRFYAYWISNVIHFFTDSAAIGQLSAVQMSSYKTAYCSKNEQREIAAYLDEKTSAIDSLVAKKNQLVAELERLKKSLIFEYVTGKKEVPT